LCPSEGFLFDEVTPLAVYQGPVKEAVVAAKQARNSGLAIALGRRLARLLLETANDSKFDLVTFVPTPVSKRLQRGGISGAACIAAGVGQVLGTPPLALLSQTRRIAKQSLLPDELRHQNVLNAFAIKRSYAWKPLPKPRDRHILLIDDVLTTGSTASEVAGVLKRAGAARVHLAVAARAVRR
jgi:predicted amidophosphoribosyltransferase